MIRDVDIIGCEHNVANWANKLKNAFGRGLPHTGHSATFCALPRQTLLA